MQRIIPTSPVRCAVILFVALQLVFVSSTVARAADSARVFATPQEAINALDKAADSTNRAAFAELFGPASGQLINPDPVQGAHELANFSAAFNVTNRLVPQSGSKMTLEVGPDAWPFPIPLVKRTNGWQFDTQAGVEEILNRRIGRNELEVLSVMREYVDAQREYAGRDRDGDEVLEYAQKLASSPGKMDGLYWPIELNGEISPLGPLVAEAQGEGYFTETGVTNSAPQPFHGYFFKILTRQGGHAPGGKYDYVINGNMIGGFAMVAWPADYEQSGVMTFIVNQQGRVYQKNLGSNTDELVDGMKAYDLDAGWQLSGD